MKVMQQFIEETTLVAPIVSDNKEERVFLAGKPNWRRRNDIALETGGLTTRSCTLPATTAIQVTESTRLMQVHYLLQ